MSNKQQKNKSDFIKAIFNVKQYTKNLKKNATNYQDMSSSIQSQDQINSYNDPPFTAKTSSKFYQSKNQLMYSVTSLKDSSFDQKDKKTKSKMINSSYEVAYPKLKKSSHSQLQKSVGVEQIGKTYAFPGYSLAKIKHSNNNSFAMHESLGMNNDDKIKLKNKNSNTYSNFNDRSDKSDLQGDKNSFSKKVKEVSTLKNTSKVKGKQNNSDLFFDQNPQIVQNLLVKIEELRNTIQLYQCAILSIRKQYLTMKQQTVNAVYTSHMIDTLKQQIQDEKTKNKILRQQIEAKQSQYQLYDTMILQSVKQLTDTLQPEFVKIQQLTKENKVLRQLLQIADRLQSKNITSSQLLNSTTPKQQKEVSKQKSLKAETQEKEKGSQQRLQKDYLRSSEQGQKKYSKEEGDKKPKFSINLQKLKQKINQKKKIV